MGKLDGKIAIVTGAASGIGRRCAERFAEEGAQVVIGDIDIEGANSTADQIVRKGGKAFALPLDLADEDSVRGFYEQVLEHCGRVDILHNNAADTRAEQLGKDMAVAAMSTDIWDRAFTINARGTMLMTKYAIAPMIAAGGGSIINTSSGASLTGDFINPAYAASKAAVNSLTRYVATQYGKRGIRCNTVSPGMIKTEKSIATMTDEQFATIEKHKLTPYLGRPDDIANAAVYLASDDSRFVTAQLLCVDGGITAHMPHVAEFRAAFEADPDNREVR